MEARNTAVAVFIQAERDPALLAFIKCHLTSMDRWNILRVLSEDPGYHWPPDEVAHLAQRAGDATRRSLEELATEGLVARHDGPEGPFYALEGTAPTARLLARLQVEAARNHRLRQIIVARMLEGRGSAASPLHGLTSASQVDASLGCIQAGDHPLPQTLPGSPDVQHPR